MSLLDKLLQNPIVSDLPHLHIALLAKNRGLRKEWLVHMDRFIEEANTWNFERQWTFVSWLLSTCEGETDASFLLIHPLKDRLLKPTLKKWMKELPDDVDRTAGMVFSLMKMTVTSTYKKRLHVGEDGSS